MVNAGLCKIGGGLKSENIKFDNFIKRQFMIIFFEDDNLQLSLS
jgi:hypothetical protein